MSSPYSWLFLLHALAGAVALGIFIIPLVSKKGGAVHLRTGQTYSVSMVIVAFTAFLISFWRLALDPSKTQASRNFAIFLFFIAYFTLTTLWYGLRVLKHKARFAPDRSLPHLGPPLLLMLVSVGVMIMGFSVKNPLLSYFPIVSYLTARKQFKYWTSAPASKMHWWYAHMEGMITACIATVTAFLVTAVPRILSQSSMTQSLLLWIAPGVILGTLLKRWTAYYEARFEAKAPKTAS